MPIAKPLKVLDVYPSEEGRSLIENTAFRELKQGWCLKKYPKKTEAAIRGHVFLTLITFTLANAFRSDLGQELTRHGPSAEVKHAPRGTTNDENCLVICYSSHQTGRV